MSRARKHLFDDDEDDVVNARGQAVQGVLPQGRGGARQLRPNVDSDEGAWRPSRSASSAQRPLISTSAAIPRRNGLSRTSADTLSDIRSLVKGDYPEALSDSFQPITLALEMLDTSSLGRHRELDKFKAINHEIEQALRSTVNEHFQGFNSSVGTHTFMVAAVERCQKNVTTTRDMLLRAKAQLSIQRTDLLDLNQRSRQLNEVLQVLKDMYVAGEPILDPLQMLTSRITERI